MSELDIVYEVLKEAGGKLHFLELYKRAEAKGLESDAVNPARSLYRAVRMDIRRQGASSKFRQPENAYLCLSEVHPDYTPLSEVKKQLPRELRDQPKSRLSLPVLCGTCTNIQYQGMQEYEQRQGVCDLWEKSLRLAVQAAEPGCWYWHQRTPSQRLMDRKVREELEPYVLNPLAAHVLNERKKRSKK